MSQEIVKDGILCIPLYHGTATLFSDSIKQHGLGAVNPIKDHSVLSFMKEVFELCDRCFTNEPDWEASKFAPTWIIDQKNFFASANFQHGETYLTPSRSSAVGYALTNRFGSECLTETYRLFMLLKERKPLVLAENKLDEHPLVKLFSYRSEPVLVTVESVPLTYLASENGGPVELVINNLIEMLAVFRARESVGPRDILRSSGITLNYNFRLIKPLPPGTLTLEVLSVADEQNPYAW